MGFPPLTLVGIRPLPNFRVRGVIHSRIVLLPLKRMSLDKSQVPQIPDLTPLWTSLFSIVVTKMDSRVQRAVVEF